MALTINDLPNELLERISLSASPTEFCTLRHAVRPLWLCTTGREEHCLKHFLVTKVVERGVIETTFRGKRHSMLDKPAVTYPNGTQVWYQHGKIHRDNGPAIIRPDGLKKWYQHGEKHRDDGPAVIHPDGRMWWYQRGKVHRDNDQPAWTCPRGRKAWYKRGVEYTPQQ